ncbi:uncharacterized protein PV07_09606 [Cladophialophora immunda]|uniref:Uncharacterized protein n=1 Tax=Cladophialophora immunda TaxID=569365 RepID=A0A0D2CSH9_9EURO|nr:uncharacterized protein PV07_09606 [Cladophialophora immunda]KIW26519.1 hypothetical protein PV07_09606 [Cladophialophora immunda]
MAGTNRQCDGAYGPRPGWLLIKYECEHNLQSGSVEMRRAWILACRRQCPRCCGSEAAAHWFCIVLGGLNPSSQDLRVMMAPASSGARLWTCCYCECLSPMIIQQIQPLIQTKVTDSPYSKTVASRGCLEHMRLAPSMPKTGQWLRTSSSLATSRGRSRASGAWELN